MKGSLKTILKEMIPVILGILIALFVNEWKTERDNERFLDQVMSSISQEVKENITELLEIIPEHRKLMDTLDHYIDDPEASISEILYKVNGVKGVHIKNTSWQSFLNPYIQLVDYETISILTEIEESKHYLSQQRANLMAFAYPVIESTEASHKSALRVLIGDLYYTEQGLLKLHESFLAERESGR